MKIAIATIIWQLAIALATANEAPGVAPTAPALRDELVRRVKQDQDARFALVQWLKEHGDPGGEQLSAQQKQAYEKATRHMKEIDAANTKWLKQVVRQHGWPAYSLVGENGGKAAWLLVQHADAKVKFQRTCLDLMRKLPDGEVSPTDVAYLTDRVLLAEGKKQLYGTQFVTKNGSFVPRSLEDEANVDQRRASMGLPPLREYVQQMKEVYGQDTKK